MKVKSSIYNLWIEAETQADTELLDKLWKSLPSRTDSNARYKWGLNVTEDDSGEPFGVEFDGKTTE
jgi:hypothetical protein